MTLLYSLRLWFYSFNICNHNDDFMCINETRKLYFLTIMKITEILLEIYLDLMMNVLGRFIAQCTSFYFIQILIFIYMHFVPNKDYESSYFKIINWHYL